MYPIEFKTKNVDVFERRRIDPLLAGGLKLQVRAGEVGKGMDLTLEKHRYIVQHDDHALVRNSEPSRPSVHMLHDPWSIIYLETDANAPHDAGVHRPGRAKHTHPCHRLIEWYLTRAQDANGNPIKVHKWYFRPLGCGFARVIRAHNNDADQFCCCELTKDRRV